MATIFATCYCGAAASGDLEGIGTCLLDVSCGFALLFSSSCDNVSISLAIIIFGSLVMQLFFCGSMVVHWWVTRYRSRFDGCPAIRWQPPAGISETEYPDLLSFTPSIHANTPDIHIHSDKAEIKQSIISLIFV